LQRLDWPQVLVIDELGYIPVEQEAAYLFSRRSGVEMSGTPIILTSNRPFSAWGNIFGDATATAAITDRLVRHAKIIGLKGSSYRI
jgi:DNA replication protein DnaC